MTHGRSFFHSEYLSPPSHLPPPTELRRRERAPALRCLHTWRTGTPRLPRRGGELPPRTRRILSPITPRCTGGGRCVPAPWGGRRGSLRGLEAFSWARRAGGFCRAGRERRALPPLSAELPWGPGRARTGHRG